MPSDKLSFPLTPVCSGPEIMKLFMLNSAEYEIFSANKYENAKNIFIFISRENFMPSNI